MLTYLSVQNFGILEKVSIEPSAGLTVITGETGTGKTLLLGALRLLMGEKADDTVVGPFGEAALIDGLFSTPEVEIGVSRRVPKGGRSQAFLEGAIVSAGTLGDRIGTYVEIAGQHDHIALRRPSTILHMIDARVTGKDPGVLGRYREAWREYQSLLAAQKAVGGDKLALERELDLLEYQIAEIEQAGLDGFDDARVEAVATRLRNVEGLATHGASALMDIHLVSEHSGDLVSNLRRLAALDPTLDSARIAAEGIADELDELQRTLETVTSDIDDSKASLGETESWLNLIGDLKRKYGRTVAEIREFSDDASARAARLRDMLGRASTIDAEIAAVQSRLKSCASDLSRQRRATGLDLIADASAHLAALGLSNARLEIEWEDLDPTPAGVDQAVLRFASDSRLELGDIGKVASGGELSRLVLALRLAARDEATTCIVFDEVDAGIGGVTALALGEKLAQLADATQVMVVTHLPQVAAHADRHYVVERAQATAAVRLLEGDDRVAELSRMLAGLPESDGGREAAAELLAAAGR